MLDPKFLEDIAARFSALAAASPAKDIEKNARALLAGAFARFELVTREEFEIQRELLARARDKAAQLEARVAALEAAAGKPGA
jgi:BMFP domain-containing protein YqiC